MTAGPAARRALVVGLAGTFVLLLAHAAVYWFLTDDAFISFRYARNLAQGHGLVFNPGQEPVEGYTNFLWVLLLALFDLAGLPPERVANLLSLLATAGLWWLVARASWRGGLERPAWIVLFPPLALAATRSVAVWSTSGLETRFFELFVVAGALRLVWEVRSEERGVPVAIPWAAVLFALATLTRPDGLLIGGCGLGAALAWLRLQGRLRPAYLGGAVCALGAPVGAHYLFRFLYYHAWLPNTYYAKVSGTWWGMGGSYLAMFALEYGVVLWIPFLVAAVVLHWRAGSLPVPLIFGAVVLPHALYIASIGGDHFEFRPLDLYFPLAFLLVADGAFCRASRARSGPVVAGALAVVLAALVDIPLRSHLEFPDVYHPGFPASEVTRREGAEFLDPSRSILFRWPVLRTVARAHRDLLRDASSHFVGLRQEEHRLFLATVREEADGLVDLETRGVLPHDLHVALDCVGIVPYRTGFRTLDRLGLTDARVARSEPATGVRVMAHEKQATLEYALERGVDLWSVQPAHLLRDPTVPWFFDEINAAEEHGLSVYLADAGGGRVIAAALPAGLERARQRLPLLRFEPMDDPSVRRTFLAAAAARWERAVQKDPADPEARSSLAEIALLAGDHALAIRLWRDLSRERPDEIHAWVRLAATTKEVGLRDEAIAAAQRAIDLARAQGLRRQLSLMEAQLEEMRAGPAGP